MTAGGQPGGVIRRGHIHHLGAHPTPGAAPDAGNPNPPLGFPANFYLSEPEAKREAATVGRGGPTVASEHPKAA